MENPACPLSRRKRAPQRESGRLDTAELARQHREKIDLPKAHLALVIDQLGRIVHGRLFIGGRQKYISAIAGLVRSNRVFVLATLRSDFYPRYQELSDLVEVAKPSGKVDLRPPTPYELGDMIRLPAEAAGLHFEQERETGQRLDQALRDAAALHRNPCRCSNTFCRCFTTSRASGVMTCSGGRITAN